jgi:hypothetical protein
MGHLKYTEIKGTNPLEALEQKRIFDKQGYPMTICPYCRRHVIRTTAHSVFDFDVMICPSCAIEEHANPKFNWIETMGSTV